MAGLKEENNIIFQGMVANTGDIKSVERILQEEIRDEDSVVRVLIVKIPKK